jgi:hypothetical protein
VGEGLNTLGIDPQDPATTVEDFHLHALQTDESKSGNPLHILIALAGVALIPVLWRRNRTACLYMLMIVVGFLIFNSYLKWELVRVRLHLPLFVLTGAYIGTLFSTLVSSRWLKVAAYVLLLAALPWLLVNRMRPLIPVDRLTSFPSVLTEPRYEQYFHESAVLGINGKDMMQEYSDAADLLLNDARCQRIGLITDKDGVEHPLWVSLWREDQPFTMVAIREQDQQAVREADVCAVIILSMDAGAFADPSVEYDYEGTYIMVQLIEP